MVDVWNFEYTQRLDTIFIRGKCEHCLDVDAMDILCQCRVKKSVLDTHYRFLNTEERYIQSFSN